LRVGVQRDCALLKHEIDVQIVVASSTQRQPFLLPLAPQHLFGRRWPVVRKVLLVTDQHQLPFEFGAPNALHGAQPGKRRTHDDDPIHRGYRSKRSFF
jgi:hypothetical protein